MKIRHYITSIRRFRGFGPPVGLVVMLVVASGLIAVQSPVAATGNNEEGPPLVKLLEAGAGYTHFTNDYGDGNDQFVAFTLSRDYSYQFRVDAGRVDRWDEEAYGIGASFTKYLGRRWHVGVGAATGTGDYLLPEYQLNAVIGRAFLKEGNLHATLGYVHHQSKGENYFDRIAGALNLWAGSHWIFGGYFNYDVGQPGSNVTKSAGVGVTVYSWKEHYLGVSAEFGDISYTQVGPSNYLVDYEQFSAKVYVTEYFSPTTGMNIRGDWATNDMYDLYGVTVSFFKEW